MKQLTIFMLTLTLLTACAPTLVPPPDAVVTSPPGKILPSPPQDIAPVEPTQPSSYVPQPGDKSLTRGGVYLDSIDLLVMESYPLQFTLVIAGNLPTPCDQLRVNVNPPDAQNRIFVEAYSVSMPGAICIQMLQPFSENVPLGSFSSGHYTIWINGEMVAKFDA